VFRLPCPELNICLALFFFACRLSVSFIQMLKAFHPVAILLISAAFKIQSSCFVLVNDKEAESES
jgi:hypothetical protein